MEKKLEFSNKEVATLFCDHMKIKGSIEEQEDGTAILAYCYDCESPQTEAKAEYSREAIEAVYDYMSYKCEYINDRIDYLARAFYEHTENHIPNPQTPSQMQQAIDAMGMGEDYEVKKRTIYASAAGEPLELQN
jgi:hypothetical protein